MRKCLQTVNIFGYPMFGGPCVAPEYYEFHVSADRDVGSGRECWLDKKSCSHHVFVDDEFTKWVRDVWEGKG